MFTDEREISWLSPSLFAMTSGIADVYRIDSDTGELDGQSWPRWVLQAVVGGDRFQIPLTKGNARRDHFIEALSDYLDQHDGEQVKVRLFALSRGFIAIEQA